MVLWTPTRPSRTYSQKDVLFIIGDWNAKVGRKETPGVTGEFGLGVLNEAGQRLIEFCQENTLVMANTLLQQHKRRLYMWTSPDGQHWNQTDYILCSRRWKSSTSSVQLLSHVQLFVTPWTAARQASLSITNSQSPPKPMFIVTIKWYTIKWLCFWC